MLQTVPPRTVLGRLPQLLLGLVLFGFGIGLMVISDLGLPPWDVLHQGVALHTPMTIGQATIAISFVVLLLWIPLRERIGIGTLANAIVIGLGVDATVALIDAPTTTWLAWLFLFGGLVVVGLGSGLYIGARLGPGPRDGLMTGIAGRGHSLRLTRMVIEVAALGVGWLLGGTFGIGTLAFAFGIGPLVQWFLPIFDVERARASSG